MFGSFNLYLISLIDNRSIQVYDFFCTSFLNCVVLENFPLTWIVKYFGIMLFLIVLYCLLNTCRICNAAPFTLDIVIHAVSPVLEHCAVFVNFYIFSKNQLLLLLWFLSIFILNLLLYLLFALFFCFSYLALLLIFPAIFNRNCFQLVGVFKAMYFPLITNLASFYLLHVHYYSEENIFWFPY